jgi:hypothetical protein
MYGLSAVLRATRFCCSERKAVISIDSDGVSWKAPPVR